MEAICPRRQLWRWACVGKSSQDFSGIARAVAPLEYTANGHHPNHAAPAHEAVLEEPPLVVPADQSRVDFEGLECPEVAAKLCDHVAHDRVCFVPACHPKHPRTHEPMHAANVGEREISPVVDVQVEIQIVRPNAHADTGRGVQINFCRANDAQADTKQAQPWKHAIVLVECLPSLGNDEDTWNLIALQGGCKSGRYSPWSSAMGSNTTTS